MQHVLDPDNGDAAGVDRLRIGRHQRLDIRPPSALRQFRRAGAVSAWRQGAAQAPAACVATEIGSQPSCCASRSGRYRPGSARNDRKRRTSRCREPKVPATSRFSKTVSFSKGCGIWNVRPMPVRQRAIGGCPGDLLAAETDRAAIGGNIARDQVEQCRFCPRRLAR